MYTVYSKPNCPQCVQAKNMIRAAGAEYIEIHLDVGQPKDPNSQYITRDELLSRIPTAKMMPQIFDGETHIGSLNDLRSSLVSMAA